MLTLILAIGIPVTYVIVGMFASRAYWFKTRKYPKLRGYHRCDRCRNEDEHYFHCIWSSTFVRIPNTIFTLIMWPLVFILTGFKSFYNAPVKKLEGSRLKLEQEIKDLKAVSDNFDKDSASWETIHANIKEKTKQLKEMG